MAEADSLSSSSHRYFEGIARARVVLRKVFRLVDEQARRFDLEPLEHQTLIQVFGSADELLNITELAERLDITLSHASRLVRALQERGLVERANSDRDRRSTLVGTTDAGLSVLRRIDVEVRAALAYYERSLGVDDRLNALSIFGLYVGIHAKPEEFAPLIERYT